MTYTPTVYDWRKSVAPIDQVFTAGGESISGGMTLGGASISNPEPGGRSSLTFDFAPFALEQTNIDASWTISRILNGSIFKIRLYKSVQLVASDDLTGPEFGLLWSNGQSWSNNSYWLWNPTGLIAGASAKGSTSVTLDLTSEGEVLKIGHVFGITSNGFDFAHMVMEISYALGIATVTVSPPLRRAVTSATRFTFRPSMNVQCTNARTVKSQFKRGRHTQLNTAEFVEALV